MRIGYARLLEHSIRTRTQALTQVTAAIHHADTATPLRFNRGFRLLLRGSSVSMLGSRVSTLAFPLLILALTGSPIVAGWACFAATAPSFFFYLPAGALVDRSDPRRAMLLSEIGRGAAVATIVVALALGKQSVILLTIAAAIEEILEVFSVLAERRFVRALVEPNQVASALIRSEGLAHMVILIGRPLGGFFFGIWRILPFAADVASFIVSVSSLFRIKKEPQGLPPRPAVSRRLGREIKEGFKWLIDYPFAGLALPLTAGATFIGQALIMVFLAEAHTRHLPSVSTGIVLAASGAGGALASAAGSRLFPWKSHSPLKIQMLIWTLTLFLLAISGGQSFIGLAITMAILGFTGALGNIAFDTFVTRYAAENMLARVMSVSRLSSFGALALGPLFGGVLVDHQGTQGAIFMLFLVTALLLAVALIALPPAVHQTRLGGGELRNRTGPTSPQRVIACLTSRRPRSRGMALPRCAARMTSAKTSRTRITYVSPVVSGGSSLITSMWSSADWVASTVYSTAMSRSASAGEFPVRSTALMNRSYLDDSE
jgi:MFS family permease